MSMLLCFGLGYSAEHFVAGYGDGFERIVGTVRSAERAAVLNAHLSGRLKALVFDGKSPTPELRHAVGDAESMLVSVPQDEHGDPVLAHFRERIRARPASSRARLSIDGGRLWRSRRRLGRREHAGRPGHTARAQPARRRASLAGFRQEPRHCGRRAAARRHLRTRTQRAHPDRARRRAAASSSPARCSTTSMSTTSRRRSTPRWRSRPHGIFNVADDEPAPPPIR